MISSCAKRGRPTGGVKDSIPPVMVIAQPENESINFKSDKIKLLFNEYIKLKDVNSQLIISPPLKYPLDITPLGTASKQVLIKIKDTLTENTTYTFNFGNSVLDNNESNILESLKYVFSTGDYIDSLKLNGSINDAFLQKADNRISILLYEIDTTYTDSTIYNKRPNYVSNTLDSTIFEFTNIKAGKYALFALKDVNRNYLFNPSEDKIGFQPNYIDLPTDSTFKLTLFKEEQPFKLIKPKEVTKGHLIFGYEGRPDSLSIKLINKPNADFYSVNSFEEDKDTLNYWYTPFETDSLLFEVRNFNYIDTVSLKIRTKKIDSLVISNSTKNTLHLRDTFKINSTIPFKSIDKTKINIIDKDSASISFNPIISKNSLNLLLDFNKQMSNSYTFYLYPEAIIDVFENTNDTIVYRNVKTKTIEDYGILNLSLSNIESFPIIIELISLRDEFIERIYTTNNKTFTFKNLKPQKYKVRLIYDTNSNGKWDTGNYLLKLNPEKIIYFPTEIEIRANWEINETFSLQ